MVLHSHYSLLHKIKAILIPRTTGLNKSTIYNYNYPYYVISDVALKYFK